jgi:hypothetical protein
LKICLNFKKFIKLVAVFCLFAAAAQDASATLPTTGKCGMYAAIPNNYGGYPAGTSDMSNLLALIDFAAQTISYKVNMVTNSNPGGTFTFSLVSGTVPFTTASNGIIDTIVFTPTGSPSPFSLNILTVNSGNSFLVQGTSGSGIERLGGVCQLQ